MCNMAGHLPLLINGMGIILAITIVKKKRSIGVEESLTINSNE